MGGGGEVSMCEYLPHINSLFVDLHTEHIPISRTGVSYALDTMKSALYVV
jgi:hypothetical protein